MADAAPDDSDLLTISLDALPHRGYPAEGEKWAHETCLKCGHQRHACRCYVNRKTGKGGQVAFIDGMVSYRFFTAPCGRRFGKTLALIWGTMEKQGRSSSFYRAIHVQTDHAKAKTLQDAFVRCLGGDPKSNPNSLIKRVKTDQGQDRWVEVKPLSVTLQDGTILRGNTGARIYFCSGSHPDFYRIQGFPFHFDDIFIDETQLQHPELITRVAIPMLNDSMGSLTLTGHPQRGMPGNHEFQKFYLRGLSDDPRYAHYGALNFPSEANPIISLQANADGRQACANENEEREEYDGLFSNDGGGVFPKIDKAFVLPVLEQVPDFFLRLQSSTPLPKAFAYFHEAPHPLKRYVVGIDWGKLYDATIIHVFDRTTNRQVAFCRILGEDYEEQLIYVRAFRAAYNNAHVNGDNNGVGEAMGERLAREYRTGYTPHKFSAHNKEMYVRRGAIMFKNEAIQMIDEPTQKQEFINYTVLLNKRSDRAGGSSATLKYGHPEGEHDDHVDAFLVLTDFLALNPTSQRPEPVEQHKRFTMGALRQRLKKKRVEEAAARARFGV